jgi:AsmA family
MKFGKILIGLVVAVVAVVAIVVFLGLQNINQLVKMAVETEGPKVTGTSVVLGRVDLSVMEGRGELHGLEIGNPTGYASEYAFSMGEVALQVEPKSLTQKVIVINEILVDGAKLIAEQKTISQTNLQDILDHIKAGGSKKAAEPSGASPAGESPAADVRLMVEKFSFVNSNVRLITIEWGERTLTLPNINVKNIGDREVGLTPEQLTQALLDPILAQAKASVANNLEDLAKDKAKDELQKKLDEKLDDEQKDQLNQLKGLFGK